MQKHIKLRWIGSGVMGGPMCRHLISAGFSITMKPDLPGRLLAKQLYEKVHKMGHGKSAPQALLLALDECVETL